MKFVLALALVLTTSFFGFSQDPVTNPNSSTEGSVFSDLLVMADSLQSDPDFQAGLTELGEGLLSMVGLAPESILHTSLPDFVLTDLNGNTITNDDLYGKLVFLHIWHPDYPVAPQAITQLHQLQQAYRYKDVVFLSLTIAPSEYLKHYRDKYPTNFQQLTNAGDLILQLSFTPQNILVDRHGTIRYITTSFSDLMTQKTTLNLPAIREQLDALLIE